MNPLLADGDAESFGLAEQIRTRLRRADRGAHRPGSPSGCRRRLNALAHLCENLADYSHYRRIRYVVLGLLAWLMSYLLRTAAVRAADPLLLFDFVGEKDGPIRSQSQTCYARLTGDGETRLPRAR